MDRYETQLRTDITSCDEEIVRFKAEIETRVARKNTLAYALTVYAATGPHRRAPAESAGRPESYSSRVLEVIRNAGPQGLSRDGIFQKVKEAGLEVKHGNIRSVLHSRRQSGTLERLPDGRHRFVSSSSNGAHPPNENEATTDASEKNAGSVEGASGVLPLTQSQTDA